MMEESISVADFTGFSFAALLQRQKNTSREAAGVFLFLESSEWKSSYSHTSYDGKQTLNIRHSVRFCVEGGIATPVSALRYRL